MNSTNTEIIDAHPTFLTKVDLFGTLNTTNTSLTTFCHREELEGVLIPLSSCQISALTFWFTNGDVQNLALRGLKADFKQNNSGIFFESLEYTSDSSKVTDREPDLLNFEHGEYIKTLTITTSETNGMIAALEFTTTVKNRKAIACGIPQNNESLADKVATIPPGKRVTFDFSKENGYLVGFYGQLDGEHIIHLGGYVAPIKHINYSIRKPYIIGYKITSKHKEILEDVAKKLGVEKDEYGKIKDAKLTDKSSKVLYYLYDAGVTNYDLIRTVFDYLT